MLANCQLFGTDTGFPDVCLTPAPPAPAPVPVPYPNIAIGTTYLRFAPKVLFMAGPAHNLLSKAALSNGDNAGVGLGVASGSVMGPARHVTAAFTVLVQGIPVTRVTSIAVQNRTNCPGVRTVPSQCKVVVLAP